MTLRIALSVVLVACGGAHDRHDASVPDAGPVADSPAADTALPPVPEVVPTTDDADQPAIEETTGTIEAAADDAPGAVDEAPPCEPTAITSVASAPLTGVPCGTWSEAADGLLGPDGYALLAGSNGAACLEGDVVVPMAPLPVTVEWLDAAPTAFASVRTLSLGGSTILTVPAGAAHPPLYTHAVVQAALPQPTTPLGLCATSSSAEETWQVDDLVAVAGLAPVFGGVVFIPFPPPPTSMTVVAGEATQLDVTCSDPDVQENPFLVFVTESLWEAPSWVAFENQSTGYDPVSKTFHNVLRIAPSGSTTGAVTFSIVCTDGQGLHANLWTTVTVVPP